MFLPAIRDREPASLLTLLVATTRRNRQSPRMVEFLTNQGDGRAHVLLAHGAGAPMDSPFLTLFAEALAGHDVTVARFEFAYMAERRIDGTRRPPPRAEALQDEYRAAISKYRERIHPAEVLAIGGKSMGGRVATMIANEAYGSGLISAVLALGYPFHPQGKPDQLRTQHLAALDCPTLIVQGERDPFGSRDEVEGYGLSSAIRLHWVGDGDHDFEPRGRSGYTKRGNLADAAAAVARFMAAV